MSPSPGENGNGADVEGRVSIVLAGGAQGVGNVAPSAQLSRSAASSGGTRRLFDPEAPP